jgi:hypothetical protein
MFFKYKEKIVILFFVLLLPFFNSCAVVKIIDDGSPKFKVVAKSKNGKQHTSTKGDINIVDEGGIESISFSITNCGSYKSYTVDVFRDETKIHSASISDNQESGKCNLFILDGVDVKDEGKYYVSFTGATIDSNSEKSTRMDVQGNSPTVIYAAKLSFGQVRVENDGGENESSQDGHDLTINFKVDSFMYAVPLGEGCSYTKINYEWKKDGTTIATDEVSTAGSSCTWHPTSSSSFNGTLDNGTYTMSAVGTKTDGSQGEPIKYPKVTLTAQSSTPVHEDPAIKVTVHKHNGQDTSFTGENVVTIPDQIDSIDYTLTNCSIFNTYSYEAKRDGDSLENKTNQQGLSPTCLITTLSGDAVSKIGTYVVSVTGKFADDNSTSLLTASAKINYTYEPPAEPELKIKIGDTIYSYADDGKSFDNKDLITENVEVYLDNCTETVSSSDLAIYVLTSKTGTSGSYTQYTIPYSIHSQQTVEPQAGKCVIFTGRKYADFTRDSYPYVQLSVKGSIKKQTGGDIPNSNYSVFINF